MTVKAVLIDIDNTILDFTKSADMAIKICSERAGLDLPENYLEVFLAVNDRLWGLLEQRKIEKQDIYDRRWTEIFSILKIDEDGKKFEDDFRSTIRDIAIPVDGAEEILRYLSSKYPVYCASNASRERQKHRLSLNGFDKFISGLFISEDIGYQKPAREFFDACISALAPLKKEELVMIGDSVSADIKGAENAGIQSIWFNIKGESPEKYGPPPVYVNKLSEIKEIL